VYESGNRKVVRNSAVGIVTRCGPGRGEIFFFARPARPRGPPNLLHNGNRVISWGKVAGAWR